MTLLRRVAAIEVQVADAAHAGTVQPHPIPDMTGQPVPVIVDAALAAMADAHPPDERASTWPCASCTALVDLASRYGDPIGREWPDPFRCCLADTIDAELKRRGDEKT